MSFTKKHIEIQIILASGTFSSGTNSISIKGLGTKVEIEKVNPPDNGKAKIEIHGMRTDDMATLTAVSFKPLEYRRNLVKVLAGDNEDELSIVFQGEITVAYSNYTNAPDISFFIDAMSGYIPQLTAIESISYNGEVRIETVISGLASEAGYTFVNEGVTGSMLNPVFTGTILERAKKIANDYNFTLLVEDNQFIILPKNQARKGAIPLLSAKSGLYGYPSFSSTGLAFNCYYTPSIKIGGQVEVDSIVPKASGIWRVVKLNHSLSANLVGVDVWQSSIQAVPAGYM